MTKLKVGAIIIVIKFFASLKMRRKESNVKKFLKTSVLALLVAVMLAFAACGGINQAAADAINKKVEDGGMTVEEVIDKHGEPTMKIDIFGSGTLIYVVGCKDEEEFEEKLEKILEEDSDEKIAAMVVTFANNKVVKAVYEDNYDGE